MYIFISKNNVFCLKKILDYKKMIQKPEMRTRLKFKISKTIFK